MPQSINQTLIENDSTRLFGLRVGDHSLHLAIADPMPSGRYQVTIDEVQCQNPSGWLNAAGAESFRNAVKLLADRHDMHRGRVAVSLDGAICVTRITTGTPDEVDRELKTLSDRVPRYLQLGPGEKVTGGHRSRLESNVDYAITGVMNRTKIQLIYETLRDTDIAPCWAEPSLVSIARLIGRSNSTENFPVLVADGTDVGIAYSGRLMLDYRPAAATDEFAFSGALRSHISRLKLFCRRHRGISSEGLDRLLICGNGEKLRDRIDAVGDSLGITPELLEASEIDDLYQLSDNHRVADSVPAVAAVLPLLIGLSENDVPDMLEKVRRAPDSTWIGRAFRYGWPAMVAGIILMISFGLVWSERNRAQLTAFDREQIQGRMQEVEARLVKLHERRGWLDYLKQIEGESAEPNWNLIFEQITQSLPPNVKLNEYNVAEGGQIRLDGTVRDENTVYDLVEELQQLPEIEQVALQGTNPEGESGHTRFVIRLTSRKRNTQPVSGARHE